MQRSKPEKRKWSSPVMCTCVKVTYDVLSPTRLQGQIAVFETFISIQIKDELGAKRRFTLQDFTIKTWPDLNTMIIIGTGNRDNNDVYLFFASDRARENCLLTMKLLDFSIVDEFNHLVTKSQMTTSNSLPSMRTIFEDPDL